MGGTGWQSPDRLHAQAVAGKEGPSALQSAGRAAPAGIRRRPPAAERAPGRLVNASSGRGWACRGGAVRMRTGPGLHAHAASRSTHGLRRLRPRVLLPWPSAPSSALWGSVCIRVHAAHRTRTDAGTPSGSVSRALLPIAERAASQLPLWASAPRAQTALRSVAPAASSPDRASCPPACIQARRLQAPRPTVTRRRGAGGGRKGRASRSGIASGSRTLRAMPPPPPDDGDFGLLFAFGYHSDARLWAEGRRTWALHRALRRT